MLREACVVQHSATHSSYTPLAWVCFLASRTMADNDFARWQAARWEDVLSITGLDASELQRIEHQLGGLFDEVCVAHALRACS